MILQKDATTLNPAVSSTRRTHPGRSIAVRLLAVAALIGFICLLGDLRRERAVLSQLEQHAALLQTRVGPDGRIPRNLEPREPPDRVDGEPALVWLSAEQLDAMQSDRLPSVMVVYTRSLPMVLSSNGRGVIFFEGGRFYARWLPDREFDQANKAQQFRVHPN